MNSASSDNRGTINQRGNVWSIDNALVEEVSTRDGRTGSVLVSYAVRGKQGMTYIELLQLNVSRNTVVINQRGQNISLSRIMPGMLIDAEFSPAMTASIPPQTSAFRIVVKERRPNPLPPPPPPPPPPADRTSTEWIIKVDTRNSYLLTGSRNNIKRMTRFNVTNNTVILNRRGRRISLRDLRPGQLVRITHGNFQTFSIPPQTTAFRIEVI